MPNQNLFGDSSIAAGYANARPPVHPEVMAKVRQRLDQPAVPVALDIGCGSGLSTRALSGLATQAIGLEPAESMLRYAPQIAPGSAFTVGLAEALPFADRSIDLMAAAGSLNYCSDLSSFWQEAGRVLRGDGKGRLVVYDFSPGRKLRRANDPALEEWFGKFMQRYPRAKDNARSLDPATLGESARGTLTLEWSEAFQIPLRLDYSFYVDYMMTETNVAYAVRTGAAAEPEIRKWCEDSLAPIFASEPRPEVLFEGYVALFHS